MSSYLDYIFVHLRQKARLKPELSPKFCQLSAQTRPKPDPKSPARLTTLPLRLKSVEDFNRNNSQRNIHGGNFITDITQYIYIKTILRSNMFLLLST